MDSRFCSLTACLKRFCSLTACLKNEKDTKGQSAICEGLENTKKKCKNTNYIFGRQSVLFVFYFYVFRIFCKNSKKKYKCICSKIHNRKKYESTISKIQNTKKIRTQNFKNTKYKEKTNSKISQGANPVFTVEIRKQIEKKNQNQPLVFSKPCSSDLYFFVFFGIFKYWQKTFL